jgi:nitroreductase
LNAIEAIHTRNSIAQLQDPAPSDEQLQAILKSGLRASDHRRLQPWRFLVLQGDARVKFGELALELALRDTPDLSEAEQQKILAKPLRAPLIVVVVAATQPDMFEKVPEVEQLLSAGGAAQLMLVAAHALDVGAIWRTGGLAYDRRFASALGLGADDKIVGFLYMGTTKNAKPLKPLDLEPFVTHWQG